MQFIKYANANILTLLTSLFNVAQIGYSADKISIDAFFGSFESKHNITKTVIEDKIIAYKGDNVKVGMIFYPGANVDYTSYEPLMAACAELGIMSFVFKMPLNVALLDIDAAKEIKGKFPEIKDWYIGGHSLGGVAAGMYIAKHLDEFKGLILFASFIINNVSESNLKVLTLYGSEDKVLNINLYNIFKQYLPAHFKEIVIEGGCHACFGMYGTQKGDGIPTISNAEQIKFTAAQISKFLEE